MSRRQINPVIPSYDLRLWKFDSYIVEFPTAGLAVQLGAKSTQLVEFAFIEADLANLDFIGIGMKNVQLFAAGVATKCFTQLSPGESIQFEQGFNSMLNGRLTAPDGDVVAAMLAPELDRIDMQQFWGISGPNSPPNTLHITIGSRTR
jgi:hypothetical protein